MAIIGATPHDMLPYKFLEALPKVAGSNDVSLGFSHKHAIVVALDVLSELDEGEKDRILEGVYNVFEMWKNEHGIYPPERLSDVVLGRRTKSLPAREYIKLQKKVAAIAGEDEPAYIEPWECDNYAKTPVRLLMKLVGAGYPPLLALMGKDQAEVRFDYILATVIIMSHNSEKGANQSSDCIEGALKLARIRMGTQKALIENMESWARQVFNRKRNAKLKREAQKEETERKVLELHECYMRQGIDRPYKIYSDELGVSESQITRILRKNGYRRYKK